jgi:DNA-binding NarL/FixJ family response regulator
VVTQRQREVLGLMAEGRSNSATAEALVVTERVLEKHVTGILSKLNLSPAVEGYPRVFGVLVFLGSA